MTEETGRFFYVVGLQRLPTSTLTAICHHLGCPNTGEYGIVQDFCVHTMPLLVTPLCSVHFQEWHERQPPVPASDGEERGR